MMKAYLRTGAVLLLASLTQLPAAVLYVDLNSPNPNPPYADWSTAATTIQDAVDAASAGDTIWVTNGLYQTGGRPAPGEILTNRVVVTNAITLRSVNGPAVTVIAGYQVPTSIVGDAAVRCAYLADGCTIDGFTLANGATRQFLNFNLSAEGHGGGVWCQSTNVTVRNCIIVSNCCSFYGGGIYSGTASGCQIQNNSTRSGSLGGGGGAAYSVVSDSTIRSNYVIGGIAPGGAWACIISNSIIEQNLSGGVGYCSLYNCSILNNSNNLRGGGAIQCLLNNCTVSGNSSAQYGGGLYNCTLYHTVVSSNQAGSYGGGLYYDQQTNTMGQSNLVCGNVCPYFGGGIVLSGGSSLKTWDLVNWTVVSNSAARDGGGLYLFSGQHGPVQLNGSTLAGNYAAGNGGGCCSAAAPLTLSNCTFSGNIALGSGGGAYSVGLANCLVTGNQAGNGGGLFGTATNCVFTGNSAGTNGGGLYCSPASFVPGCSFTNNSAMYGGGTYGGYLANSILWGNLALTNGGGIYGSAFSNCLVMSNQAAFGGGAFEPNGGTFYYPPTSFVCLNSTIRGNSARNDAGGLYFSSTPVAGTNCLIADNMAGNNGGGLVNGTFSRSTFAGNSAGANGGGTYNTLLSLSSLSNNTAGANGGGAYGGGLTLSVIANNVAKTNGGGACNSGPVNCLVTGNSAATGGGVYGAPSSSSTIVNNQANSAGGGIYISSGNGGTACIIYYNTAPNGPNIAGSGGYNYCCTTPAPSGGTGNLTAAPSFVDLANGNYRLQTNSPCINTGSSPTTTFDLDGRFRIAGGRTDMGAYEFQGPGMGEFTAWLQQYGLSTSGSADYTDQDQDGLNNWQEWLAGTEPTNAASILRMLTPSIAADGTGSLVSWQSVSNRSYFLQRSTDLFAPTAFSTLQSNITGQLDITGYLDTNAPGIGPAFYRVGVQ